MIFFMTPVKQSHAYCNFQNLQSNRHKARFSRQTRKWGWKLAVRANCNLDLVFMLLSLFPLMRKSLSKVITILFNTYCEREQNQQTQFRNNGNSMPTGTVISISSGISINSMFYSCIALGSRLFDHRALISLWTVVWIAPYLLYYD